MRRLLLATVLALSPGLAVADETIAGQWQASLGHGVIIAMDVLADGHWSSQTVQNNRVVAEMAGTYQQDSKTPASGELVFTPVTSQTSPQHGPAQVEKDRYTVAAGGQVLRLVSGKDSMEFHRQPYAK
jgi:hypothetical protein